jgi:hypothetical protein
MPQFYAKHTQGPCPIVINQRVSKVSMSVGTLKIWYRLVSPEEAGDKTEMDMGSPRGPGLSSKEFTVRGCPNGG